MNSIIDKIDFDSEHIALIQDERRISYQQLELMVLELCNFLEESKCNGVVAVIDNSIEWVVIDLACQNARIPFIPLPHFFTQSQIQSAVENTKTDTVFLPKSESIISKLDKLYPTRQSNCPLKGVVCLQNNANRLIEMPVNTAKITFTSGSTGNPKGVCLSIKNQLVVAESLVKIVAVERPKHLCILPLSTLLENIAGIYAPLLSGGCVILASAEKRGLLGSSNLNAKQLLSCISINQPNSLILVPELLFLLVSAAENGWQVPNSLKFIAVGGSKVSQELLERTDRVNLPVYQGYGLSECSSVVALCSANSNKLGTVGKPLPHIKLQIKNNKIVIKGNCFLGYLGDKASWYRKEFNSGDLGTIDEDGFCTVNGREKNLIISSYGRNVSPEWIESYFLQQDSSDEDLFQQCFVFGDSKPFCVALFYLFDSSITNHKIEQAVERVNQKLPDYAQIKNWMVLDKPLTCSDGLLTENGRPRRKVIGQHFHKQIERLTYSKYEASFIKAVTSNYLLNSNKLNNQLLNNGATPMSFFQRLVNETQEAKNYLFKAPIISQCMSGSIDKDDYVAFLKEAYHHVKHTVPLLMSVGSKLPENKEWLREAVAEYIEEELGHQEWILNDIAACGFDKEEARRSQPSWATELMVSYAYDSINRVNPLNFFGMIHVLEGTSIALADMAADSILKALSFPYDPIKGVEKNAFTYLRSHGSLDIEHVKFFESLMNKMTDEKEQQLVIDAANKFYHLYGEIFYSLKASHGFSIAA